MSIAKPPNSPHTPLSIGSTSLKSEPVSRRHTCAHCPDLFGVQPHRQRTFKLSNDPFFIEKVRDIVGLYLNPPDHAVVLCVDEKSRIQALERTQPMLPMGLGYVEGVTHDYVRHGTTTLFAALDVASGQVLAQCKRRHRHQEFLAFLRHIDRNVPKTLDVHLVVDHYATHKHAKVKAWLARRPRYHIHYTPTYASWLNQVERWFGIITQQAIRRGTFSSVKQLTRKIDRFVNDYNSTNRPFVWIATADSILAKVERLSKHNRLPLNRQRPSSSVALHSGTGGLKRKIRRVVRILGRGKVDLPSFPNRMRRTSRRSFVVACRA